MDKLNNALDGLMSEKLRIERGVERLERRSHRHIQKTTDSSCPACIVSWFFF